MGGRFGKYGDIKRRERIRKTRIQRSESYRKVRKKERSHKAQGLCSFLQGK